MIQIDDYELYNRRYSYIVFEGKYFSPRQFELETKLKLFEISEPNEIYSESSNNKRIRGTTCKEGSAILQTPLHILHERNWLLNKLARFKNVFKKFGIEKITLWELAYFIPNSQMNFEINPLQLKQLADLKINYCLSIYEIEKDVTKILPKRFWQIKSRTK